GVQVKGLAHITGGGFPDNVPRVLPAHLEAHIDRTSWTVPPVFRLLVERAGMDEDEAYRVFNMGMGMVAVVRPQDASRATEVIPGARVIGETTRKT
ncbi:MAG: phosphoribosylformylglycinamidine cyclo-ligase, partial [Caldilineae bacterium]